MAENSVKISNASATKLTFSIEDQYNVFIKEFTLNLKEACEIKLNNEEYNFRVSKINEDYSEMLFKAIPSCNMAFVNEFVTKNLCLQDIKNFKRYNNCLQTGFDEISDSGFMLVSAGAPKKHAVFHQLQSVFDKNLRNQIINLQKNVLKKRKTFAFEESKGFGFNRQSTFDDELDLRIKALKSKNAQLNEIKKSEKGNTEEFSINTNLFNLKKSEDYNNQGNLFGKYIY